IYLKKLTLFLTFTLALVLAACGNGEDSDNGEAEGNGDDGRVAELQEAGTVNVGFANEPPYAFENSDTGELEGANIEIATAVFEEKIGRASCRESGKNG